MVSSTLNPFQELQLALAARDALIAYNRTIKVWADLTMPYLIDHASVDVLRKLAQQMEGFSRLRPC